MLFRSAKKQVEEIVGKIADMVTDAELQRTIKHKDLDKNVSYQYLMRLECYKLIKNLLGEKEYEPFKIWW